MSHSTNSNLNFCNVCNVSFETNKGLYRHQSCESKHKELLEKMFGPVDDGGITEPLAKTMERMFDSDKDFIYPKPSTKTKTENKTKDNTKEIFKTKSITKPEIKTEDSIYSGIKFECRECHAEFRNKIN